MKRSLKALLCAAALFAAHTPALAQDEEQSSVTPQPDAVTHDWAFDFEHAAPDTIAVEDPDGKVRWYWYITYKITNYDSESLFFDPKIEIQNDAGKIIAANKGIDNRVFFAVRKLVENPLLMSPLEVPGRVLRGDDYARRSVIIWEAGEEDVDEFRLFVGGIFGEIKEVMDPTTGKPLTTPIIDPMTGEPKKDSAGHVLMQPLILYRTRMLHYKTPGTTINLQDPSIELVDSKDVMR